MERWVGSAAGAPAAARQSASLRATFSDASRWGLGELRQHRPAQVHQPPAPSASALLERPHSRVHPLHDCVCPCCLPSDGSWTNSPSSLSAQGKGRCGESRWCRRHCSVLGCAEEGWNPALHGLAGCSVTLPHLMGKRTYRHVGKEPLPYACMRTPLGPLRKSQSLSLFLCLHELFKKQTKGGIWLTVSRHPVPHQGASPLQLPAEADPGRQRGRVQEVGSLPPP